MARIELRNTTIYLQDGLSGTAAVNDAGGVAESDTTATIDTVSLNTSDDDLVPVGARFTFAGDANVYTVTARTPSSSSPTTDITFTPAKVSGSGSAADDSVITFQSQQLEIKIGEGDLTWTENREFNYDLDRDQLDTVRQGADVPMDVELNFTFEYVTTESGQTITPVDALKQTGEAGEWVTSSSDACEPYAVDIYAVHDIPCGTDQDEDFLLPDFRWESLDYSISDAAISVSGRCNATEATVSRGDLA